MQIKHETKGGLERTELCLNVCLSQYNAEKLLLFSDRNYNP